MDEGVHHFDQERRFVLYTEPTLPFKMAKFVDPDLQCECILKDPNLWHFHFWPIFCPNFHGFPLPSSTELRPCWALIRLIFRKAINWNWSLVHIFSRHQYDFGFWGRLESSHSCLFYWAKLQFTGTTGWTGFRALCDTCFSPKMRKFLKLRFWLREWIFWQWPWSTIIPEMVFVTRMFSFVCTLCLSPFRAELNKVKIWFPLHIVN